MCTCANRLNARRKLYTGSIIPVAAVVIPTEGRQTTLYSAIESAFEAARMAGPIEIIVVNDSPNDIVFNGEEKGSLSSLRFVRNNRTKGPSGARNCGVEEATAPLIFFLDDDDRFIATYIRDTLHILETAGSSAVFGHSSVMIEGRKKNKGRSAGLITSASPLKDYIAPLSAGVWVRRSSFIEAGSLNEKMRINEDTEFFLRLASLKLVGWHSSAPGVVIRPIDPQDIKETPSLTRRVCPIERAEVFEQIISLHSDLLEANLDIKRKYQTRIVKYLARSGKIRAAIRAGQRHHLGVTRIYLEVLIGYFSSRTATSANSPTVNNERHMGST